MRCPYCSKNTIIDRVVQMNLEAYGESVKARTKCCGKIIRVWPVITFRCDITDQSETDDWGK